MAVMRTCPLCGSGDIYVSLGKVECPNPDCTNFTVQQAQEVVTSHIKRGFAKALEGVTFGEPSPPFREASDEEVRKFKERVSGISCSADLSTDCPACAAGIPVKTRPYWTETSLRLAAAQAIAETEPQTDMVLHLKKNQKGHMVFTLNKNRDARRKD